MPPTAKRSLRPMDAISAMDTKVRVESARDLRRSRSRIRRSRSTSGSGFAALVYEIVWLQQLQLVIGSSAVSLGLLLATYMGGLFLGSIAVPSLISAKRHPLWLYGVIEFGIGVFGLLILFGLPLIG